MEKPTLFVVENKQKLTKSKFSVTLNNAQTRSFLNKMQKKNKILKQLIEIHSNDLNKVLMNTEKTFQK